MDHETRHWKRSPNGASTGFRTENILVKLNGRPLCLNRDPGVSDGRSGLVLLVPDVFERTVGGARLVVAIEQSGQAHDDMLFGAEQMAAKGFGKIVQASLLDGGQDPVMFPLR